MRLNSHSLALMAITVSAIVPAAAAATPSTEAGTQSSPAACAKDYSQNSATGENCGSGNSPRYANVPTSPSSSVASSSPAQLVNKDDGFSWGDAGAGAGGMLALVLAGAAGTTVVRRRRSPAAIG
jgi:hypothetical protein